MKSDQVFILYTRPDKVLICLPAEADNIIISVDHWVVLSSLKGWRVLISDTRDHSHQYAYGRKVISRHQADIVHTNSLYGSIAYWYVFPQNLISSNKFISSPNHIYANSDFSDIAIDKNHRMQASSYATSVTLLCSVQVIKTAHHWCWSSGIMATHERADTDPECSMVIISFLFYSAAARLLHTVRYSLHTSVISTMDVSRVNVWGDSGELIFTFTIYSFCRYIIPALSSGRYPIPVVSAMDLCAHSCALFTPVGLLIDCHFLDTSHREMGKRFHRIHRNV